jgi:hypothetical protein
VLKASAAYNLTTTSTNSAVENTFALNGLFNVDLTHSSTTPFMWSVINTLYNKYRVDRARYTIRFYDTTADGCVVGAQLRGATTAGVGITALGNRPGNVVHTMSNTGQQEVVIHAATDCAQAFGQTKAIYHANYGAVVSSNPGGSSPDYTLVLHLFLASAVTAAVTVQYQLDIEYDVDLFDVQV